MKLFKPELSNGDLIPVVIKAVCKEDAITKAECWLKHSLNEEQREYFTETYTPTIADAIELKEDCFGVVVV